MVVLWCDAWCWHLVLGVPALCCQTLTHSFRVFPHTQPYTAVCTYAYTGECCVTDAVVIGVRVWVCVCVCVFRDAVQTSNTVLLVNKSHVEIEPWRFPAETSEPQGIAYVCA